MRRRSILGLLLVPALRALPGCASLGASGARPTGRTFTATGVKLWYEVHGEKGATPLVVINGGPGFDHTYLRGSDAWEQLARHRPVVLYDQRGTGQSEPWSADRPQTLADHVADLEALRVELGAAQVDLLGHSWGGYLGLAYALKHPQQIGRLVLCDSAAPRFNDTLYLFNALFPDTMERHARLDALRAGGDKAAGESAIRELFGTLFVSAEKREEFLKKNEGVHFNYEMNQALEASIADHDMWPALPSVRVPALVITGRFDANVGPETAWKIHKGIPGSRIVFFERSGHFPFVEETDRFVEVVEGFLEGR